MSVAEVQGDGTDRLAGAAASHDAIDAISASAALLAVKIFEPAAR